MSTCPRTVWQRAGRLIIAESDRGWIEYAIRSLGARIYKIVGSSAGLRLSLKCAVMTWEIIEMPGVESRAPFGHFHVASARDQIMKVPALEHAMKVKRICDVLRLEFSVSNKN